MERFSFAAELPEEWDSLAGDNCYLKRNFLSFMERTDACGQAYYIFRNSQGKIDSIMMTYTRENYNLFMFTKRTIRVKMTFVYVPLSVTRPGFVCGKDTQGELVRAIRSIQGYKIILNAEQNFSPKGFARGMTCPKCLLDIRWNSMEEYFSALRSGYRRRFKQAMERSKPLTMEFLEDNSAFDQSLYRLYLEVYEKSRIRIECLPIAFFQGPFFKIFVMRDGEKPVGFTQLIENGEELIFEFVGLDHRAQHTYDTYLRMLLEIVRYGIERGFRVIDFGQTADDAKLKLGCRYHYLYALLGHSNPLVTLFAKMIAKKIEYRPLPEGKFHVFGGENR